MFFFSVRTAVVECQDCRLLVSGEIKHSSESIIPYIECWWRHEKNENNQYIAEERLYTEANFFVLLGKSNTARTSIPWKYYSRGNKQTI